MEIINRVTQSPLITFKIETLYPTGERVVLDIKDQLFQGLILREKDFRTFIQAHEWSQYQDKYVAVTCSADAIVPVWAYMLIATRLSGVAKDFVFGSVPNLDLYLLNKAMDTLDFSEYSGKPVVIKGCSDIALPVAVYVEVTKRLKPFAKKISYGEPCSTVPL
ncbi:MAG: DUF2480 family protein [Bacteroidia bacterium]|nr:DUF2480 family protein [Bacteroidia bacterium]